MELKKIVDSITNYFYEVKDYFFKVKQAGPLGVNAERDMQLLYSMSSEIQYLTASDGHRYLYYTPLYPIYIDRAAYLFKQNGIKVNKHRTEKDGKWEPKMVLRCRVRYLCQIKRYNNFANRLINGNFERIENQSLDRILFKVCPNVR